MSRGENLTDVIRFRHGFAGRQRLKTAKGRVRFYGVPDPLPAYRFKKG
jgi:hypothetical protein